MDAPTSTERNLAGFLGPSWPFEDQEPDSRWLAMHIFYSSNNNPLLTDCVIPLLADLRRDRLIRRFFFIRYWMEGPHIRLRLRPATPRDEPEVRRRAEGAVDAFLARRPALYELDAQLLAGVYKELFLQEYTEADWLARYGEHGQMPLRDNNSRAYIDYEPEYDRYGGPDGVRLAEWHFERSSTVVLHLVQTANVHVRTVLFGLSGQMMVAMCAAFLGDREQMAAFFESYGMFWEQRAADPTGTRTAGYDRAYAEMSESLPRRVAEIHAAVTTRDFSRLTGFMRSWATHCVELREHIVRLTGQERMLFPPWGHPGGPEPLTDPEVVLRVLLNGYLHMTNNRLGVSIVDEIYLAYVLRRALVDLARPVVSR